MMESIVSVAIQFKTPSEFDDHLFKGQRVYPEYLTVSALPPARHSNIMHPMAVATGITCPSNQQGFITSTGRFVDRKEAYLIASAAGQLLDNNPSRLEGILYSEDLW